MLQVLLDPWHKPKPSFPQPQQTGFSRGVPQQPCAWSPSVTIVVIAVVVFGKTLSRTGVLDVIIGVTASAKGSSDPSSSCTHLLGGQKPEAQLDLHHCVIAGSPVLLFHREDKAAAAVNEGEGSSVGRYRILGAANEAAAPMNSIELAQHKKLVA